MWGPLGLKVHSNLHWVRIEVSLCCLKREVAIYAILRACFAFIFLFSFLGGGRGGRVSLFPFHLCEKKRTFKAE